MSRAPAGSASRLAEVAAALTEFFEEIFATIRPLRAVVEAQLREEPGPMHSRDLHAEAAAADLLRRDGGLANGAGFVAAPGFLVDSPNWFEWWTVETPGRGARLRRVMLESSTDGTQTYDYSTSPWLVVPRETGRRHVTGPYVDYFCTKAYALTLTEPVNAAGAFAGVVGVDVPVAAIEHRVAGRLGTLGAPVALVNASGRVVTTVDFGALTGDLLREAPVAALWAGETGHAGYALARCGTLPLGVLVRTG